MTMHLAPSPDQPRWRPILERRSRDRPVTQDDLRALERRLTWRILATGVIVLGGVSGLALLL